MKQVLTITLALLVFTNCNAMAAARFEQNTPRHVSAFVDSTQLMLAQADIPAAAPHADVPVSFEAMIRRAREDARTGVSYAPAEITAEAAALEAQVQASGRCGENGREFQVINKSDRLGRILAITDENKDCLMGDGVNGIK